MSKIKVYIASPYTIGDQAKNVRVQIDCFQKLREYRLIPFAPLLSHFQHMVHPNTYDEWLEWDFAWIDVCDCLLRLPGESRGADLEVEHARLRGIPVFYSIDDILKHYGMFKDYDE